MRTIKTITLLLGTLAFLLTLNLSATAKCFNLEEEAYINDIPFSTEDIALECKYQHAITVEYNFSEEAYIEDIPFDTECVTAECKYRKAIKVIFSFDDEAYIDDIPSTMNAFQVGKKYQQLSSRN